jgi:formate--tetrahydrofolate ligase
MAHNVPSDLEIAQAAKMERITDIAERLGITDDELEPHGKYMAKINLSVLDRLEKNPDGKFITVTAITPTPLGEGKTVTNIGLGQGMAKIGKRVVNTLREPSKGPTFGIKGGAAGGGYSQVVPMEEINLHFTGDIHAAETANNLANAALDASILHGNKLNIDPGNVNLKRCVDLNDRALRDVVIGLGGKANGYPRQTGYDITVATEVAAIVAMTSGLFDLRERIGRMVTAFTYDKKPVTCEDLKVAGAMTVLLKEAIKPNLVQTLENTPVINHGFPFANVAHGNNSVLADMVALKLGDYVITESGFGADCGAEKLIDVKCRASGLKLDTIVITCSIRALKMHGGAFVLKPGQNYATIKEAAESENMKALEKGANNLRVHLENMLSFGAPVVVTVNKFHFDTDREVDFLVKYAKDHGAFGAAPIEAWAKGGEGCTEAAQLVCDACDQPNDFHLLYPDDMPIEEKIRTICQKIYRADDIEMSPLAKRKAKLYTELGYSHLSINNAKTHLSLSHDPTLLGVPKGFRVPIRDIRLSAGAGFLYPLLGEMRTMPGLPSEPAFWKVDIDKDGKTVGLF